MKEKYLLIREYVDDRGLGITCNCDEWVLDTYQSEEEAIKEFGYYLDANANQIYTEEDHPFHKTFNQLSVVKEVLNEYEEWEVEEWIKVAYFQD